MLAVIARAADPGDEEEAAPGLAPEPPAGRASGLALERGASLPGLAVAWPGRGASDSRSVIRHARHVLHSW